MKDITRVDEERYLQEKIEKNLIDSSPFTFAGVISKIKNGDIILEPLADDGTKVIDTKSIEEIKKVIPCLINISNKPRSFIKNIEEKVPVELAKKINHKAIMELSKDSNDWHSRTILSVHPKNIVSDLNEETLDLYENRFIITLIDKITRAISEKKSFNIQLRNAYLEKQLNMAINEEYLYNKNNSFQFFNKISKNTDYSNENSDFIKKLDEEDKEIIDIEKKLKIIRSSEFYNVLRRCRRVTNPIQKTNILMFDFDYNNGYKLWKILDQFFESEEVNMEPDVTYDLEICYKNYVMLLIFASLEDLGFNETSNNKITIKNGVVSNVRLSFVRDKISINLEISDNFEFVLNMNKVNYKFVITTDYSNFEGKNRIDIKAITDKIISSLEITNKKEDKDITGKYCFVSMNMTRCVKDNPLSNQLYRRFYNIGDNYTYDETEDFNKKFADYKSGIQIVMPATLRASFLRIERLLNYQILGHITRKELDLGCPICKGKIKKLNNNDYMCGNCNHMITFATHTNCCINNKKEFVWIKYNDSKFLEKDAVVGNEKAEEYTKINLYQNILGEYGINSFVIEKEKDSFKLKTICPYCGKKLGE